MVHRDQQSSTKQQWTNGPRWCWARSQTTSSFASNSRQDNVENTGWQTPNLWLHSTIGPQHFSNYHSDLAVLASFWSRHLSCHSKVATNALMLSYCRLAAVRAVSCRFEQLIWPKPKPNDGESHNWQRKPTPIFRMIHSLYSTSTPQGMMNAPWMCSWLRSGGYYSCGSNTYAGRWMETDLAGATGGGLKMWKCDWLKWFGFGLLANLLVSLSLPICCL